jgi:hypothetical protein
MYHHLVVQLDEKVLKCLGNMNFFRIWNETTFIYQNIPDLVVDIGEQFPLLPVEETIVIADELAEMPMDFLVTINNNGQFQHLARTVRN